MYVSIVPSLFTYINWNPYLTTKLMILLSLYTLSKSKHNDNDNITIPKQLLLALISEIVIHTARYGFQVARI